MRKDLLILLGACYAFYEPSKLASIPADIVDQWRSCAEEAIPLIAGLLAQRQPNASDLLYLLSTLAAVSGYPALARAIEDIDYQPE